MKRFLIWFSAWLLLATSFATGHSGLAQGMLDKGKSLLGGGGAGSMLGGGGGIAGGLPLDKILSLLGKQGYTGVTGLGPTEKGDALQASALNPSGSPVNLLINPTTGNVISALAR